MATHKDDTLDVGTWIFRQRFGNHRRMVVIQMPDRKRYVSRTTIKGLLRGFFRRRTGQIFACHITRNNKIAEVTEGNMRRLIITGTEMATYFGGFDRRKGHPLSGDVYEVDAIKREGDTVVVRLAKRLSKAKKPFNFTLKEWKSRAAKVLPVPEMQRVPLRIVG